jgi:hypothetical protein
MSDTVSSCGALTPVVATNVKAKWVSCCIRSCAETGRKLGNAGWHDVANMETSKKRLYGLRPIFVDFLEGVLGNSRSCFHADMMRLRLGSSVWLSTLLLILLPVSAAAQRERVFERRDQQLPACAVSGRAPLRLVLYRSSHRGETSLTRTID